ncbi:hypothetical protein V2J09_006122 [Rumex salicifolius]
MILEIGGPCYSELCQWSATQVTWSFGYPQMGSNLNYKQRKYGACLCTGLVCLNSLAIDSSATLHSAPLL